MIRFLGDAEVPDPADLSVWLLWQVKEEPLTGCGRASPPPPPAGRTQACPLGTRAVVPPGGRRLSARGELGPQEGD